MTVKEIVKKYLEDNGFDGLAGNMCGCELKSLMPCDCDSNMSDCIASKKIGACGCIGKHSGDCYLLEDE